MSESEKRLYMLFWLGWRFSPDLICSLLLYLENNPPFPIKHSKEDHVYKASLSLVNDYRPIIYQWELNKGEIGEFVITIIPQMKPNRKEGASFSTNLANPRTLPDGKLRRESAYLLCLDFGTKPTAEALFERGSVPDFRWSRWNKIKNLLRFGMYLFDATAAVLTYESQPNSDTRLWANRIAEVWRLPLVFSSRLKFSPARTCMADDDSVLSGSFDSPIFLFPTDRPSLEPKYSIWVDLRCENYYRVPEEQVFLIGVHVVLHSFSSLVKSVNQSQISSYAISKSIAAEYIIPELANFWQSALVKINEWIHFCAATVRREQTIRGVCLNEQYAWEQIVRECNRIRYLQTQPNSETVGSWILKLVARLQDLLESDEFALAPTRDSAIKTAKNISHLFSIEDLGAENSIEQSITNIRQFNELGEAARLSTKSIS